jgi:putative chitinase
MISEYQLAVLAPRAKPVYAAALSGAMSKFGIDKLENRAAFIAQVLHESAGLQVFSENLNYAAAALTVMWPTRFTRETANQYGRTSAHPADPVMIANIAYANRMGNGAPATGDGWRYRGRGPIQLTGKNNYSLCGSAIGIDLVTTPDALLDPAIGCMSAAWFWSAGNRTGQSLNKLGADIDAISRVINGGEHGLVDRRVLYAKALQVLA